MNKFHFNSRFAKIILPNHQAISLFGHVFFKQEMHEVSPKLIYHEARHVQQMTELGFIKFYFLYVFEWIRNIVQGQKSMEAYRNISFEKDAVEYSIKMTERK